jgi:hypothetical protein
MHLTYTGFHGELGHLKIETRLRVERFERAKTRRGGGRRCRCYERRRAQA